MIGERRSSGFGCFGGVKPTNLLILLKDVIAEKSIFCKTKPTQYFWDSTIPNLPCSTKRRCGRMGSYRTCGKGGAR